MVSSRVNSVSSILQGPGVREKFIKQSNRVFFKLPNDIKSVLCNFETSNDVKEYETLKQLLREGAVRDNDFAEFLVEARQCVSILSAKHESFIQVLLKIQWTDRSPEVITNYKLFLQDLVCMQTHYTKTVINHLVQLFKPVEDNNVEHEVGKFEDEDIKRLNHIHDILNKILQVVPMSNKVLLQSLCLQFPFVIRGTYTHEVYIYALLQVLNYAPQLRSDILCLIINRLVMLDVNIPRKEVDNDKKDDLTDCIDETDDNQTDDNDVDERNVVNLTARTLDTCMELFLKYMHEFCFENGVLKTESMKMLYFDVLRIFETVILPTYASQYVQYIAFYICSFKVVVVETFTNWLWSKVIDPNAPSVIRQSAVCYISSLLASASFVPFGLIKLRMFKLAAWICDYITMQECLDHIDDMELHVVFYSVCQAFFHLFIARHKEFLEAENGILFLQELDITKIVNCKLNPLKICDNKIVHNFADITSTYQLAYCYAVIENNERNQLPIFGIKTHSPFLISKFFPFESYTLQYSGQRILPLFHSNIVNAPRSEKSYE